MVRLLYARHLGRPVMGNYAIVILNEALRRGASRSEGSL